MYINNNNNAVINNNNNGRLQDLSLLQHASSKMLVSLGLVTVTTLTELHQLLSVQLMEGHILVISAVFPPISINIMKTFKI